MKDTITENDKGTLVLEGGNLTELAAAGTLIFRGKKLVPDLYSKVKLGYRVEVDGEDVLITPYIKTAKREFSITIIEGIGKGNPCWIVSKGFLRAVDPDVPWSWLKQAVKEGERFLSRSDAIDFIEQCHDLEIPVEGDTVRPPSISQQPVLCLCDRAGSFANLEMESSGRHPFNRSNPEEAAWERDLLETEFTVKQVGSSAYHCPTDQVRKSLLFLLECGWTVIDHRGRRVCPVESTDMSVVEAGDRIEISARIRFEDYEATLAEVTGSFNRRESFISLSGGAVGILSDDKLDGQLRQLAENSEVIGDVASVSTRNFGVLGELLDSPQWEVTPEIEELRASLRDFSGIIPVEPGPGFDGTLRDYQQEGVSWLHFLYRYHLGGILADDMGLGKTVQALAFLSGLEEAGPSLIVAPRSVIHHWANESAHFLPRTPVYVHHGTVRGELPDSGIIITTYGTLRQDLPMIQKTSFHAVICDEAQAIKNAQSQTSRAVCSLKARFRLSVTGTPIENRPEELWAQFRFVDPHLFGTEPEFQANLQTSASRIRQQVRPLVLRRKKSEVAAELPEKTEQVVHVEMRSEQRSIYENLLASYRQNLVSKIGSDGLGKKRMEVFEAILRLRQICCSPLLVESLLEEAPVIFSGKMDALLSDLETIVSEGSKVLVFSQFTSVLNLIQQEISKRNWESLRLDGSTRDREKVVQRFQEGDIPIFLMSLKAGGVGLNLTSADYVLLFDPWWNDAVESQAIDRAHRIGRHDPVIAKRYVTIDSVEEKMMKMKAAKRLVADELLDDTMVPSGLTDQDLLDLL